MGGGRPPPSLLLERRGNQEIKPGMLPNPNRDNFPSGLWKLRDVSAHAVTVWSHYLPRHPCNACQTCFAPTFPGKVPYNCGSYAIWKERCALEWGGDSRIELQPHVLSSTPSSLLQTLEGTIFYPYVCGVISLFIIFMALMYSRPFPQSLPPVVSLPVSYIRL